MERRSIAVQGTVQGVGFRPFVFALASGLDLRGFVRNGGISAVALSGGVFMNCLLAAEVAGRLEVEGFRVYRHHLVPPNDGGLSLGQLAVAAARVAAGGEDSGGDADVPGNSR